MKAMSRLYPSVISLCAILITNYPASTQQKSKSGNDKPKDRARVLVSKDLPQLDGNHLKVTLVEVDYGPGEASKPHSHPCAVLGYVASGRLRTQVKGEPEMIYQAGETFYEAPNGVHLVSANASVTEPAKLLAYLICDHEAPLSVDPSKSSRQKGSAQ